MSSIDWKIKKLKCSEDKIKSISVDVKIAWKLMTMKLWREQ